MPAANIETEPIADAVVTGDGLDAIIAKLRESGHLVIGPRFQNGAIVHGEISGAGDLPRGRRDIQAAGAYRVEMRDDGALFGFSAAAHSWKPYLQPPLVRLFTARREGQDVSIAGVADQPQRLAFFGMRPCDLAALKILDRVLLERTFVDEDYRRRRDRLFVVAANCTDPASTCFCGSLGTGPHASGGGYDLAMTEIVDAAGARFVVEIGTRAGGDVMSAVPSRAVRQEDRDAVNGLRERAKAELRTHLDVEGLAEWLIDHPDHPNWAAVAERCLTCGNCTLVCPTCFCTSVRDVTSLAGDLTERHRLWDSCFTSEFSYIHGGTIRQSTTARLRHRITHKLGTWRAQFGTAGCTGCGRCTTWCPAAIDMTTEVCAMRHAIARAPEADYADA